MFINIGKDVKNIIELICLLISEKMLKTDSLCLLTLEKMLKTDMFANIGLQIKNRYVC